MHIGYVDADKPEEKWKVEKYSQHLACERCNLVDLCPSALPAAVAAVRAERRSRAGA